MLNPRFELKGSFTIWGVMAAGQPGEINYAEVWEKLYAPMDVALKKVSDDGINYGVSLNEGNQMVYLAGVAAADGAPLLAGAARRVVPGARFAVFDCTLASMPSIAQEIYGQWFHASDFEPDPQAIGFERYISDGPAGMLRVELYIPIRQKSITAVSKTASQPGVFEIIDNRRSIRRYKNDPVPPEALNRILQAGIKAPSGMNRQPWKFYVVQGEKHRTMVEMLMTGLVNREQEGMNISGARHSFEVMAQAPVNVFVYRPDRMSPWLAQTDEQYRRDLVDVQSVGAAIQNMLLAAEELGIGSLWVCDVFLASREISQWLGEASELIAAICLGYADEHPVARKRKSFDEVVRMV